MNSLRSFVLALSLVCVALVVSTPKQVQAGEEVTVPPDVVTTKDGGMYRGTIVAKIPGKYVEITLSNGETERLEMDNVEYAGPREGLAKAGATEQSQPELVLGFAVSSPDEARVDVAGLRQRRQPGFAPGASYRTTF